MSYQEPKYKPVSCDFVDWIEHLATLRKPVSINYFDNLKMRYESDVLIKTWENRGEDGEYLVLANNGGEIRLDHIAAIDGKGPGDMCKI